MSYPQYNRNFSLSRRRLNVESLEDRLLLSATGWGGFDPVPDVNVYAVEDSEIGIDFGGQTDFDQVAVADMNKDGIMDVVTLRDAQSAPVISVHLGEGAGNYAAGQTFELSTPGGAAAGLLADLTGDGVLEYVSTAQNTSSGTYLVTTVHRYSGGAFSLAGTSTVPLSVFGNYSVYAVTSIGLAAVDGNLAVQLENSYAFDSSGGVHSIDGLVVCTGSGAGTFSNPRLVPTFTGEAVGSVSLDGVDYLVSLNKETRSFGFWYYNDAKLTWSSAGSIGYASELGSVAVTAVTASDDALFLTGTLSGQTIAAEFSLDVSAMGKIILNSSQVYTLDNVFSSQTALADGDLNADGRGDLLVIDPNRYTVLFGKADGTYEVTETTVAQTDYLTTVLLDPEGDGRIEILAVGGIGVWKILVDAPDADPTPYGIFDTPAAAAVTGDFDGDGSIEIAVIESESSLVAIYDEQGDRYEKTFVVEAPTREIDGVTVTASPVGLAVGSFTSSIRSQVLIRYTWSTGDGDTFVVYDAAQNQQPLWIELTSGETATAFAAGNITSAVYDDIVAVISDGTNLSVVQWGNSSGRLTRKAGVLLGAVDSLSITETAVANLDGRGRGDIVLFDTDAEKGARLGWLTSAGSTFSQSGLGWGERVAADGIFSGLLLSDITGDDVPDAVTTRTYTDDGGIQRSVIYLAEGAVSSTVPFGALDGCALGGEYAAGIPFDGGSLAGPSLLSCTDPITELGDLILAKGRTAAAVYSLEGGTGNEAFRYLAHASSSALPTSIISNTTSLGNDYYNWVDEWSSFYVEIWGCANGNEINRFKTSLTFDTTYFTAMAVESGRGYTASMTVDGGICTVSGTAERPSTPATGKYALLARVLFTATPTGGVAIPDNGAFTAYNAGFGVTGESINGSAYCSGSDASALTGLNIFSVRFDSNDDGNVNVVDFTLFANNYGLGTASQPFRDEKAETFNVVSGNGLNVRDFTFFANVYGQTRGGVTADRFYDKCGIDPTAWLASAAILPTESAFAAPMESAVPVEAAAPAETASAPETTTSSVEVIAAVPAVATAVPAKAAAAPMAEVRGEAFLPFAAEDQDEYEWFDFDAR